MKKKRLLFLFIIILFIFIINSNNINKTNSDNDIEKINLSEINDNYYDISINVNDSTATIDGKKYKIEEIEDISKNELYDYIKDNSYGEVTLKNDEIKITNPYSLESLIVQTDNISVLDEYDNIERIEEISDNLYKVEYNNAKDTKDGFEELKNDEKINKVSTDIKVVAFNDVSSYDVTMDSWGVSSMGLDFYTSKIKEGNNNVVKIAVLDTGIRSTHEAFTSVEEKDRIDYDGAYDYVNDDNDPTDDNYQTTYEDKNGVEHTVVDYGHGTMVSGIIAESTPKNVKIVPIKVLDSNGTGSLSDILHAINDIKDKVDIINLSLGASISDDIFDNELKTIYENSNLIIVAASGNESTSVSYPASSLYTLAISSVDINNNFSSLFSNYGNEVDFAAPGEDLLLPAIQGDDKYVSGKSGTSFSSPFAAAAIALIKMNNPTLTRDEIINILKQNVVDLGTKGKDKYYGYGSISLHSIINDISVSDKWNKTNTLTVTAEAASDTNYYAITTEEIEPTNWISLPKTQNISISQEINENGIHYLWIKNNSKTTKTIGNTLKNFDNIGITHTQFVVNKIDNIKPLVINEMSVSNKTTSSIDLSLSVKDETSGLSKVVWYYKRSNDSSYNTIVDELNGELTNVDLSKSINNLDHYTNYNIYAEIYDQANNITKTNVNTISTLSEGNLPSVSYTTHVQNIGWQNYVQDGIMAGTSGQSLRLEGIKIKLENQNYSGDIEYRTHIQNIGWESSFKKNDEMSGTSGLSYRLEAIEIKLTGEMEEHYDIYYRVHAQNFGWLGWARNGEKSGTAGYAYRLEGIEIKLVLKGNKLEEYGSGVIFYDKNIGKIVPIKDDALVGYTTHVQNVGWQNYVVDGQMAGTSGQSLRLEGIKVKLLNQEYSGNIEYRTHIQNIGWETNFKKNDEMSGTSGLSYRLEAIEIKLTGEIEEYYDVYYRVHAQNFGWLGWAKNGEQAGTAGFAYRLEGIEIKLVPKGETFIGYGLGLKCFYQQ